MMKFFRKLVMAVLSVSLAIAPCNIMAKANDNQSIRIDSVVIFGDSLSDSGNIYELLSALNSYKDDKNSADVQNHLVKPLTSYIHIIAARLIEQGVAPAAVASLDYLLQNNAQLLDTILMYISSGSAIAVIPGQPYWHKHFSNGPVWDEYIAAHLFGGSPETVSALLPKSIYTNRAFGGSWAVMNDHQLINYLEAGDLQAAINDLFRGEMIPPSFYLVEHAFQLNHHAISMKGNTLYFVFYGGNDYLNIFSLPNMDANAVKTYADTVVKAIVGDVEHMIDNGAKYIVIAGMPDVAKTPRFLHSPHKDLLAMAVQRHNDSLRAMIGTLSAKYPHVKFSFVDIAKILNNIINNQDGKYSQFTVKNKACTNYQLPGGVNPLYSPLATGMPTLFANDISLQEAFFVQKRYQQLQTTAGLGAENYMICSKAEQPHYVFWDEVHPTTATHLVLAKEMMQQLQAEGYEMQLP